MAVPRCRRVRFRLPAVIIVSLTVLAGAGPVARAADLAVLTAGAFKPALLDLAQSFRTRTGNTLVITNDSVGGVAARIARGEQTDVVILPAAAMERLTAQGRIVADSVLTVAKSGIGVVVGKDAPVPDISTQEAFRLTMLATPSFAYIDPETGDPNAVYLAKLFDRLGIADAMRAKAVLVPDGLTASRVDDGEAALALQQVSALQVVSGVRFVGALPAAIQNYTLYAGAVPTAASRPAAGRALLAFLRDDVAVHALAARGFDPP